MKKQHRKDKKKHDKTIEKLKDAHVHQIELLKMQLEEKEKRNLDLNLRLENLKKDVKEKDKDILDLAKRPSVYVNCAVTARMLNPEILLKMCKEIVTNIVAYWKDLGMDSGWIEDQINAGITDEINNKIQFPEDRKKIFEILNAETINSKIVNHLALEMKK